MNLHTKMFIKVRWDIRCKTQHRRRDAMRQNSLYDAPSMTWKSYIINPLKRSQEPNYTNTVFWKSPQKSLILHQLWKYLITVDCLFNARVLIKI